MALYGLIAANTVSQLGNVVALIALPWFVLETTGSPALTGIAAFAATLPLALGAVVAGPVVDRLGARRASVLADLAAGAAIAGIPLVHALRGGVPFPLVLALAFAAGAFEAPGRTARRAMLPDLADRAGVARERANAVSTTSEHLGYLIGAPLAGVLIAALGAPGALWADAGSFAVSAGLVALLVPAVRAAREPAGLLDGVRVVLGRPRLRAMFTIWTVGAFLIAPLSGLILPVYADRRLGGAGALAAAVTVFGAGGLAGTVAFGGYGRRLPRRPFFVAMWTVYPVLTGALILLPPFWPLLALLFVVGFTVGAYDPFEVTIHQELVPAPLRARAFAVLLASEMAVVPLAMLLYGLLMDAAGLRAALVFLAAGNVLLGLYAIANRATRDLGYSS
jgi:MFS family permease